VHARYVSRQFGSGGLTKVCGCGGGGVLLPKNDTDKQLHACTHDARDTHPLHTHTHTQVAFDFGASNDGSGSYKWDGGRNPIESEKKKEMAEKMAEMK